MTLPQNQKPLVIENYVNARTVEEACKALNHGDGLIVAGGTDLWVQKDEGVKSFGQRLINISRISDLRNIEIGDGRIRIGALVTMTKVLNDQALKDIVPVLAATADRFASVQIRNAATIGGNIANASPAGDFIIPLLCLDAEVELARLENGKISTRRMALNEFFVGPGKTKRATEELIIAVEFAKPGKGHTAAFCKTGPRPALEISIVSLGFAANVSGGTMSNVRIACGAVAPTPVRCAKTEQLLEGQTASDDVIAKALESISEEISPIGDVRGSAWYRQRLARAYLEQELRNVAQG
ncbi:MAG: xanthine dehydrogenase family protein subunit M [Fimbriimonadaceae bacterium]|nr:xanthine dehydrogenase family protein subunit M [Alphaproteobacteria bacterium]